MKHPHSVLEELLNREWGGWQKKPGNARNEAINATPMVIWIR